MEKASKIIKRTRVFATKKLDGAAQAALVCNKADRAMRNIFDRDFCKALSVVSFKEETVWIGVSNPVYAQEIKIREEALVNETNKLLGKKIVSKVGFRTNK